MPGHRPSSHREAGKIHGRCLAVLPTVFGCLDMVLSPCDLCRFHLLIKRIAHERTLISLHRADNLKAAFWPGNDIRDGWNL